MVLPPLKDLKRVIALCRSQGVKCIKIDNVEITLADEQPQPRTRKSKSATIPATSKYGPVDQAFESDSLTDEQLLFYSASDPVGMEPKEST